MTRHGCSNHWDGNANQWFAFADKLVGRANGSTYETISCDRTTTPIARQTNSRTNTATHSALFPQPSVYFSKEFGCGKRAEAAQSV